MTISTRPCRVLLVQARNGCGVAARLGAGGVEVVDSVASVGDVAAMFCAERHHLVVLVPDTRTACPTELVHELRRSIADRPIAVVLDTDDPRPIAEWVRAGAAAVVSSNADDTELAVAIATAAPGARVLDPGAAQALASAWLPAHDGQLSARELEVLEYLATGLTNAQIARHLYVSAETIKSHVARLLRKLDSQNRVDVVAKARRLGLLTVQPPTNIQPTPIEQGLTSASTHR